VELVETAVAVEAELDDVVLSLPFGEVELVETASEGFKVDKGAIKVASFRGSGISGNKCSSFTNSITRDCDLYHGVTNYND
jgi:hypothetical protein